MLGLGCSLYQSDSFDGGVPLVVLLGVMNAELSKLCQIKKLVAASVYTNFFLLYIICVVVPPYV